MGKKTTAFNLDGAPSDPPGELPAADLSSIGATLVNEIPEPQQHAIDQANAERETETGTASDVEVDELGMPWNPEFHATGSDGKGIRTSRGTWRKRRGVSGSPSQLNTGRAKVDEPAPPTVEQQTEAQCRMAGAMMGTLMVRLSVGVGGNAFLPRMLTIPGLQQPVSEQDMLNGAWGDYFVANGITTLPPWAALMGALSMYYLPRFQDTEVRQRVGGVMGWFKDKITRTVVWWKYRKQGGKAPKNRKVSDKEREGATDAETSDANA